MNVVHENFARQGLVRPADGRLLTGTCAGVARRFGMDPWAVRALFVVSLAVLPGTQFVIYPVLWLLMPEERGSYVPADEPPAPYA